MPTDLRHDAVYCSSRCMSAVHRKRAVRAAVPKACDSCGREFKPDKPTRQFYCLSCSANATKRRHDIACAQCGTMFHPTTYTAKFCSLSCVAKHKHAIGVLRHYPRRLTARLADRMFDSMRCKRPYHRRLTPARVDALFDRLAYQR